MLLCVSSYHHLSVLYNALELPPIGTVLKFEGIQIQSQPNTNLHFIVLRRRDKEQHIAMAQQVVDASKTLVLDPNYEGGIGNVADLESHLPLTDRGRNKIATEIFGEATIETFQRDALLGFRILTTLVMRKRQRAPPPPPPLKIHKRIKSSSCVACMDSDASVQFNCGHECVCQACCDEWLKINPACPVCKVKVTDLYK